MLKKILIIDDDETTCFLNKIFLEDMQVSEEIECLYDAREAVERIRNLCFGGSYNQNGQDLILLDINMPIMNGFEFLEKIEQFEGVGNLCSKRVVMYTSSIHPKDIERANSHGVLAYVQKPFTKSKLESVIEDFYNQDL